MSHERQSARQVAILGMAGAFSAMLAVALGAFGAHYLKARLSTYYLEVYLTAVEYQMFHSLALILVVTLSRFHIASRPVIACLVWSGRLFVFGIVLFCGSLYLLVATQVKGLGAVTPLGGVAFILAWTCLLVAFKRTLSLSVKET